MNYTPPRLDPNAVEADHVPEFTPGYFQRAASIMPKQGKRKPWKLDENYVLDSLSLRWGSIDDDVLEFSPRHQ
jgi:monooxygenase